MKRLTVSSEFLKWFALLAMTVDHIDSVWVELGWLNSTLGRMAFPIFSFLLISNFQKYHPVKKYLFRLGCFALLTELLLFYFSTKNVLFTFFYALLFIGFVQKVCQLTKMFWVQGYFCVLFLVAFLPFISKADYGVFGFLFLLALYAYLQKKNKINYWAVLLSGAFLNPENWLKIAVTLFTLIILLKGIKVANGRRFMKWWFFYLYYPLHKFILYALKVI